MPAAAPVSASLAPVAPKTIAPERSLTSVSLDPLDTFARRHLGPGDAAVGEMLALLGYDSLEALTNDAVPSRIHLRRALDLPAARGESQTLQDLKVILSGNQIFRSFIGQGYNDTLTPPVIQRNILENPGWYTGYTPYQAEIAQGRLEALLNFQTMIIDLTGMEIANASLLDEGTAAAEAMNLAFSLRENESALSFFVADDCHPQTIHVVRTRAVPLGIHVVVGPVADFVPDASTFGILLQYPATTGEIRDYSSIIDQVHAHKGFAIVAADLLSLALLRPPGEFGADVAVGNTQRFGVPLGGGGPHAAYFATRDAFKRQMPGRLIGVSKDSQGNPALRLSLQTREQHIRRDKATSNICTAQVLLAVIASMYAVYHGPEGLKAIALRVRRLTLTLAAGLKKLDITVGPEPFFDTLCVSRKAGTADTLLSRATKSGFNFRPISDQKIGITLDETVTAAEIESIWAIFNGGQPASFSAQSLATEIAVPAPFARTSPFLTHPVFNRYHTETELLRYIRRLEARDLTLTTSMIPLGSCTMKLNATTEMIPVTWPEVGKIHPFAPESQTRGYAKLVHELTTWLGEITGLPAVSIQPNAGSQGEYAGLLAIRGYHLKRNDTGRTVCLIPLSAHGTNPASAVMAGFQVVPVACDISGNIDLPDLRAKATQHAAKLGAIMVTYPSTHGVFEETITDICEIIHQHGGLVYMDGANMNAQVGLCRPGDIGVDVCHLNLHKTFCIPHGGGGPGVGPVCCSEKLRAFLPSDPNASSPDGIGPVSAAPWGSASILVISWAYIAMLGAEGLTRATRIAILNANYIAKRLGDVFPVLYRGHASLVAHECILDFRAWKTSAGLEVEDVAKRLIDYGYHAPTMSWPVPGTLMIEPTESESKDELDRFCDAMLLIHAEMKAVASGSSDRARNVLKGAPHTARMVIGESWDRPYTREQAAYPAPWLQEHKFWPVVGRIDNVHGDRNLVCSCLPMEDYETPGS